MSLSSDKGLGKRARRQVSDRLRAYHEAVMRMIEPDSEDFFDQVIERARHEQSFGSAHAPEQARV
jgi:hypothetical protein